MGGCNCGGRKISNGEEEKRKSYTLLNVIADEVTGKAEYVDEEIRKSRIEKCNSCSHLFSMTRQCKKCGCFIDAKAKYKKAFCPLSKW